MLTIISPLFLSALLLHEASRAILGLFHPAAYSGVLSVYVEHRPWDEQLLFRRRLQNVDLVSHERSKVHLLEYLVRRHCGRLAVRRGSQALTS